MTAVWGAKLSQRFRAVFRRTIGRFESFEHAAQLFETVRDLMIVSQTLRVSWAQDGDIKRGCHVVAS